MATSSAFERTLRRRVERRHALLGEEVSRLREDAGISRARLAEQAGVDAAYLGRIEAGRERPTLTVYERIAMALGADLSARVYPNTGPRLRDHTQAPMLEHLLATRHPRFGTFTEVLVRRPSRGAIDALLHEPRERVAIATELQGQLRRLEQQIRWHAMKAESLASWDGWAQLGDPEPRISQLLVVRRTRATRAVAAEFARQLRAAYPAHPDDALGALLGTDPWPGAALMWMTLDARGARWAPER